MGSFYRAINSTFFDLSAIDSECKNSDSRCLTTILITLIFIPTGIVSNFEYDSLSSLFLIFPFLIWLAVYLRYLHSEIIDDREEDRTISAVAALLVFAAFGDWLTYWLGIITTQENHFLQDLLLEVVN